jgi:hypothetical protein
MDSNECFLDACYAWKWCAMLTRGIPYEDLCFYIIDVRTVFMKADFFAAKISCCTTLHIQSQKTRCSIDKFLSLTKTSRFHNGFWLLSFKTSFQGPELDQ